MDPSGASVPPGVEEEDTRCAAADSKCIIALAVVAVGSSPNIPPLLPLPSDAVLLTVMWLSVYERVQAELLGKGVWAAPAERNGGLWSDPDCVAELDREAWLLPLLLGRGMERWECG